MQRAYPLIIGVLSLSQSGCGGSQAQRALTQAAVITAIEVAGAALQAAADEAAAVSLKKSGASAADIAKAQAKAAATKVDYDAAYAAYKALPEEVDAWKVGEDAAAAFLKAQTK